MEKLVIEGGHKLEGSVSASGSKNSALKLIFAALLTDEKVSIKRMPNLKDVSTSITILEELGAEIEKSANSVSITAQKFSSIKAPYDLVRTMRASILVLGPLLARERRAIVSLPGGCAIGTRPIDLHMFGLEKMGTKFELKDGYLYAECKAGLKGADIKLRFASVGATENILLAATLAEGTTIIRNAAREPEIIDLIRVLKLMGAKISGEGNSEITIEGVNKLNGTNTEVMFDRIEAATLLFAGPITGGSIQVNNVEPQYLENILALMQNIGIKIEKTENSVEAAFTDNLKAINFVTDPYPGVPTDIQAQFMAFLTQIDGESEITENIFENRFMHVPELNRMGANIRTELNKAYINGKKNCLSGATVMASDLRASASLVLAGLAATGTTHVRRIYHLDRGYEHIEEKLNSIGAKVRRMQE